MTVAVNLGLFVSLFNNHSKTPNFFLFVFDLHIVMWDEINNEIVRQNTSRGCGLVTQGLVAVVGPFSKG